MTLMIPKTKFPPDRKYLDYLRTQPCIVTGRSETEPAHLRLNNMGGMGIKPPDWCALPLNWRLHREQSNAGELRSWVIWANEYPDFLARLLINEAKHRYAMWKA